MTGVECKEHVFGKGLGGFRTPRSGASATAAATATTRGSVVGQGLRRWQGRMAAFEVDQARDGRISQLEAQ